MIASLKNNVIYLTKTCQKLNLLLIMYTVTGQFLLTVFTVIEVGMRASLLTGLIVCLLPCNAVASSEVYSGGALSLLAYDQDTVLVNDANCDTLYKDQINVGSVSCVNSLETNNDNDKDEIAELVLGVVLNTIWNVTSNGSANLPVALNVREDRYGAGTRFSVESKTTACHFRLAFHF